MTFDHNKMHQAILFFVAECQNQYLGITKLMKLLYCLDFDHFEKEFRPVTGATYRRLPYGPVPVEADMMIRAMEVSNILVIDRTDAYHRLYSQEAPDLEVFADSELGTLRRVAKRWRDVRTDEMVDLVHEEAPWRLVPEWEVVPYSYSLLRQSERSGDQSESQLTDAERELIAEYIRSTHRVEGLILSPEEVAEAIRIAYSDDVPKLA